MSRIVLFGKLPPIQGGVAARTLEFVGALQNQGHEVIAITNSASASPTYAASFLDGDWVELRQRAGGAVIETLHAMPWHIPYSEAFETRLIGRAVEHCARADLVIGSYFQPYGVAAALSARITGKPCVLFHAGSDIGRLALDPDLEVAYRAILSDAKVVSTSQGSKTLLERVIKHNAVIPLESGYQLPSYFNKARVPPDVTIARISRCAEQSLLQWRGAVPEVASLASRRPRADSFVLGVYGKAGEQKGHLDLLAAISKLRSAGKTIDLVMLTGGTPSSLRTVAKRISADPYLINAVTIWPFVPPWLVPDFIDICDAVAFLERDFEISVHGPQVPKEVMWRGKPLICSSEIVKKQGFSDGMKPWVNYIPAGDPKDIDNLADTIGRAMSLSSIREIGIAGRGLVRAFVGPSRPADNMVETLVRAGLVERDVTIDRLAER